MVDGLNKVRSQRFQVGGARFVRVRLGQWEQFLIKQNNTPTV